MRVAKFCPRCGKPVTPGKQFCRSCGYDFATRNQSAPSHAAPPAYPSRQAPTRSPAPAPAPVALPGGPSAGQRALKGTLKVVVPVGAMVVTYYLTNRFAGAALAQKMNLPPQLVPMLISMAVGGLARQITK